MMLQIKRVEFLMNDIARGENIKIEGSTRGNIGEGKNR